MKVIINADDMGMSDKVNRSIIHMHQMGIVSSNTLMANAPCFNEALELLAPHPELGTGVHLCLDGPYNSASDYKSIIDPAKGTFYNNNEVVKKIRSFSLDKNEIFREFCLQIEKVLNHGIRVSHLDTHHNLHVYFPILSQVIRVAKKYGISHVRSQRMNTCVDKGCINKLYRNIHQVYLNLSLKSVSGYYYPAIQDCSDFESNLACLDRMLNSTVGIIEIMVHPQSKDDPETKFFSSPEVRNLLSRHNILNYNQLE